MSGHPPYFMSGLLSLFTCCSWVQTFFLHPFSLSLGLSACSPREHDKSYFPKWGATRSALPPSPWCWVSQLRGWADVLRNQCYPSSKSQVDTNWAKEDLGDILNELAHPVPQQTNAWRSFVGIRWTMGGGGVHFSMFLHDTAEKGREFIRCCW